MENTATIVNDFSPYYMFQRQKRHQRGVLKKRFPENMQQMYRRISMPKSDFIEITLRHGFSLVNLLHQFRAPFRKNTQGSSYSSTFNLAYSFMQRFKCNIKFNVIVYVVLFLKTGWDVVTNVKRFYMFYVRIFYIYLQTSLMFVYLQHLDQNSKTGAVLIDLGK